MSMALATKTLRRRMNQNCLRMKQGTEKVLDPLDPTPGPFTERNPFLTNGVPRKMSIICGKENEAKGNPANAGYRTMVAKVASAYKKATRTEKREISMQLAEDLQNRGYYFVFKKNEAWQEMEQTKVLEKVRHSLRDCERTRDKKHAGKVKRVDHCGHAQKKATAEESK